MRDCERITFNGLIFNNEIAYEIISDVEFELEYFYDEGIQSFSNNYEMEIEECYHRLKI